MRSYGEIAKQRDAEDKLPAKKKESMDDGFLLKGTSRYGKMSSVVIKPKTEEKNMEGKRPVWQRGWFLVLMCLFISPVGIVLLWVAKRPKNIIVRSIITGFFVMVILIGIFGSSGDESKPKDNDTETIAEADDQNSEIEELKKELKDQYDVSEPSKFVKGDATGDWRIVKVANGTAPSDYAVKYAKAYMKDGDVHYIVNFSLNTTTQMRLNAGIVEAKTTEYVAKEEHDAKVIGGGMLYTDRFFDIDTGEEITADADESKGTVESDELISAVETAIEGDVDTEHETITGVTFDGSNLTVSVDMSNADTSMLSAADIAEARISSITDSILALDDSYYNTWETVTLDFGSVGTAVLNKDMVKNEGYGRYFDYPIDILK